jgi:periplasmic protein CpxP/Spy
MLKRVMPVAVVGFLVLSGILFGGCIRKRIICSTPEQRAEFIVNRISSSLDLSKEQAEKLNKIKDEILARIKSRPNDREAFHNELIGLVKSDKLDRNMIENFIGKREERMKELKPFLIDKLVEFHNILTPEQRNRIVEKLDKFYHYCD